MPDKHLPLTETVGRLQYLQKLYSTLGIFAISIVIASISILTFYHQLRKEEEKNLRFRLHTRTLAIKEFLFRSKDVAQQISSRTQARKTLEDYNQGKIDKEIANKNISILILDALNNSQDVAGITRIARDNKLLTQVGLPIPSKFLPKLPVDSTNITVSTPIQLNGKSYLILTSSIIDSKGNQAGADIVLFKASGLQNIVEDYVISDEVGEMFLGRVNQGKVELFFSSRNSQHQSSHPVLQAISKAVSGNSGSLHSSKSLFNSKILVFEPIANNIWGIAIEVEIRELYASLHQQLLLIIITIVLLSGLSAGVMLVILQPFSNKILIYTHELEKEVGEKTAAIGELKNTQAQLIQTEKMSGLGQLVAGIAHEINNPISFVYGNLKYADDYMQNLMKLIELYQNTDKNSAKDIDYYIEEIDLEFVKDDLPKLFKSMREGATRIRDIVLSLRNFSRSDEQGIKFVDIHEGIESTLLILEHRFKAQSNRPQIQITKKYDKLPLVECDANQLNQAFMNIITNAIDALASQNQQHFPNIAIHTELLENNWVAIHIQDNGIGMNQAVQSRLFEPFFTTKPIGKGTGLGLSISYQIIVEQHRGKLWCDSTLGNGTKFTIQIPVKQDVLQ